MIGVLALLVFFCFLMGIDKMLKLILGTTVLMVVVLWWSALLRTRTFFLNKLWESWTLVWIEQTTLLNIVQSIDTTTSILLFVGLMIVVMSYAKLDIIFDSMYLSPQAQQLVLAPAAIISLVVGLSVSVVWIDVFDPIKLQIIASTLTTNSQVQTMIMYLPFWFMLQGCIVLSLISSRGVGLNRFWSEE